MLMLKAEARANVAAMFVTCDTCHAATSPLNTAAASNVACNVFTLATSQDDTPAPVKAVAPRKRWDMLKALLVSQAERLASNNFAPENM